MDQATLKNPFERIVCLNLDRRADRWDRFGREFRRAGWPLPFPERFAAVDGQACQAPVWFRAQPGAWGCLQSHIRVLEDCLAAGIDSVLIFEDDAVADPERDLTESLETFLRVVPEDWDALYFGGQHLSPPVDAGDYQIGKNVNRTHAHAMRGEHLRRAYHHLTNWATHTKTPYHHVDHRLGMLHEENRVYCPKRWLFGQAADTQSDISRNHWPKAQFWPCKDPLPAQTEAVAR